MIRLIGKLLFRTNFSFYQSYPGQRVGAVSFLGVLVFQILSSVAFGQGSPEALPRPPQFVLLSFDGSLNLDFWRASRDFAKQMNQSGRPLQFTYFVSGVYFLTSATKGQYTAPVKGPGRSDIGWSANTAAIRERVVELNHAVAEGHEMGSHLNGHFDGSKLKWTLADWQSEFQQFFHFLLNTFSIHSISPLPAYPQGWNFDVRDMAGVRAPLLGVNADYFTALSEAGFRYDASSVDVPNSWPRKNRNGLWGFPLVSLNIAGTGKRTLSMDYNFYFSQSGAVSQPQNKDRFRQEMLDTYRNYFRSQYFGTRAPLNIGHHFSLWNGGAYWEALQQFAMEICGQPEVRCVTYREYISWLESLSSPSLQAYRSGKFPRLSPPAVMGSLEGGTSEAVVSSNPWSESRLQLSLLSGPSVGLGNSSARLNGLDVLVPEILSSAQGSNRGSNISLSTDSGLATEAEPTSEAPSLASELPPLDLRFQVAGKPADRFTLAISHFSSEEDEASLPALSLARIRKEYAGAAVVHLKVRGIEPRSGREVLVATQRLLDVGLPTERLESVALEEKALQGDLPGAHSHESLVTAEQLLKSRVPFR